MAVKTATKKTSTRADVKPKGKGVEDEEGDDDLDEDDDEDDDEDEDDEDAPLVDEQGQPVTAKYIKSLQARLAETKAKQGKNFKGKRAAEREVESLKAQLAAAGKSKKAAADDDDEDDDGPDLAGERAKGKVEGQTAGDLRFIRSTARAKLKDAGLILDAKTALRLLDLEGADLEIDDDDEEEVIGLDELIEEFAEKNPKLFDKPGTRRETINAGDDVNGETTKRGRGGKSVTELQVEALTRKGR